MKLPLCLLVLAALLSWAALRLDAFMPMDRAVVAATRSAVSEPLNMRTAQSQEAPISEAPLFRAATAPVTTPQAGENFSLVGLAGAADERVVFLRDQADGGTFSARIGQDVRGWRIERADERCVVLRRARRRENICL